MVFLGYILPPKNQKIYEQDIKIAVSNEKKDKKLSKEAYDKKVYFEKTGSLLFGKNSDFLFGKNNKSMTEPAKSLVSKSLVSKTLNPNNIAGDTMTEADIKKWINNKESNDLVDFSPIKSVVNTDLDNIKINDLMGELKTKISSSNKGLKKPVFTENLVTSSVPVNALLQELKMKIKDKNRGLKQKIKESKDVVQELVETQLLTEDVLKEVIDKVVEENKDSFFETFNKTLNEKPTFSNFKEATATISDMTDFDENYIRWNKDINLYNQILKDLMEQKKITKIRLYNGKKIKNKGLTSIDFDVNGNAVKADTKTKTKLSMNQLFYTLLNAVNNDIEGAGLAKAANFGNLHISIPALRKGDLRLYKNRSNVVIVLHKNMSPLMNKIIRSIKRDMKFENDDFARLNDKEKRTISKVVNHLQIDNEIAGGVIQDENFNLKNRYEILISSINAGNGGVLVFKELKDVLKRLKNNNVISQAKFKSIMNELN